MKIQAFLTSSARIRKISPTCHRGLLSPLYADNLFLHLMRERHHDILQRFPDRDPDIHGKDTVIIIYDNSTVKYRGMDFGDTAIGAICPVVAFDNSEVGGVIQLKIDGKAAGAVTLKNGGRYMDFQKLDIPVDLTGIHDVEFVFSGKSCRFKGFTVK